MSGALQAVFQNQRTFIVTGQIAYTSAGTYTFVVPAGVTKVSGVSISGGGGGGAGSVEGCCPTYYGGIGGAGGTLGYKNNMTVTPGASHTMVVGHGAGAGCLPQVANRWFCSTTGPVNGLGSINGGCRGQNGSGNSPPGSFSGCCSALYWTGRAWGGYGGSDGCGRGGGGGGAPGYGGGTCARNSTSGGSGGQGSNAAGGSATNGGAAGGGSGSGSGSGGTAGYGGGGLGLLGQGTSGTGATGAGAGGSSGANGSGSAAGSPGGGGGGGAASSHGAGTYTSGAIRLIWPGNTRSFPSTNTGDM